MIRIYLKCLWYNKALSLGYLLALLGIFSISNDSGIGFIMIQAGIGLIGLCKGGKHTINTYIRCYEILKTRSDFKLEDTYWYCDRVGYKWAKNEINKNKGHVSNN